MFTSNIYKEAKTFIAITPAKCYIRPPTLPHNLKRSPHRKLFNILPEDIKIHLRKKSKDKPD